MRPVWLATVLLGALTTLALAAEPRVVELPVPDLDGLESVVAEQLNSGQREFARISSDPQATDTDKARAIGTLGHLYHTYDFLDAAAAAYKIAGLLDSRSFAWQYSAATVAQTQADFRTAINFYQKALPLADNANLRYLVHLRIGEAEEGLNNPDGALSAYLSAYDINPDSPAILARLGQCYLDHKQYREAVDHLERALALNPAISTLHYPLGMAYRGLGNRALAKEHMERRGTVDIQPADPLQGILANLRKGAENYIAAGNTALDARRFEDAERLFRLATESNPDHGSAWAHLATAMIELDRLEAALASLTRAIRLSPDDMTLHLVAGDLLIRLDNPEEAIGYLKTYTQNHPMNARGMALLARAHRDTGDAEAALAVYRQSVALDPHQVRPWLELIALLEDQGQFSAAVNTNREAIAELPDDATLLSRLVHSLAGSPDPDLRDAKAALQIALQLFDASPGYGHARLVAVAYAADSECDLATQWMDRSIALAEASQVGTTILTALHLNRGLFVSGTSCGPS